MVILAPADLISASVQRKLADIDRYAARLQDQPLAHNGHHYYADRGSLETITTTMAVVIMLADDAPVPTPEPGSPGYSCCFRAFFISWRRKNNEQ